ncbi:TrmB family transcriptional regulator [Nanoarchaeota archaeon]
MELNEKLLEAGLTRNETKAYLELIRKGELTANQLAKNLGIDRTLTYTILNHLIEKGQVSYTIKENKKFFKPSPPENLLNPLKKKEVVIQDLIKELNSIKTKENQETEMNIYEGIEGLRTIIKLWLKHKEFCSFGGTGRLFKQIYEAHALAKQAQKNKIKVKVIVNSENLDPEFVKYKNIQIKKRPIKSEATTSIFGEYVSIHLLKDKPIIILIKNKHIAESYRNYFNYLWR